MKNAILNLLLSLIVIVAMTSCSGSKEFRVDVVSDDIGTQNVTVIYSTGEGYHVESVSAIDGQFSFTGMLSAPTFVEIYTNSSSLLGQLIVEGGDQIKARLSAMNPENVKIEGNDDAEMLADFLKENRKMIDSGDIDGVNRVIGDFVRENPDRFVSMVLLTRFFTVEGYEKTAFELFGLIPEKRRREHFSEGFELMLNTSLASDTLKLGDIRGFGESDTVKIFNPAGAKINLLMLTDNDTRLADSIKAMLSVMRGGMPTGEELRLVDFGCDRDTMVWHTSLRAQAQEEYPEGVTRIWLNGGIATEGIAEAAPTRLPYFILTDSVGRLLYRSPSTSATQAAFGKLRKKIRL